MINRRTFMGLASASVGIPTISGTEKWVPLNQGVFLVPDFQPPGILKSIHSCPGWWAVKGKPWDLKDLEAGTPSLLCEKVHIVSKINATYYPWHILGDLHIYWMGDPEACPQATLQPADVLRLEHSKKLDFGFQIESRWISLRGL